jgi:hypothetical protein
MSDKSLILINKDLAIQNKHLKMCLGTNATTIKKLYAVIKLRDYTIKEQLVELKRLRRLSLKE